jgi:hypothetical protein
VPLQPPRENVPVKRISDQRHPAQPLNRHERQLHKLRSGALARKDVNNQGRWPGAKHVQDDAAAETRKPVSPASPDACVSWRITRLSRKPNQDHYCRGGEDRPNENVQTRTQRTEDGRREGRQREQRSKVKLMPSTANGGFRRYGATHSPLCLRIVGPNGPTFSGRCCAQIVFGTKNALPRPRSVAVSWLAPSHAAIAVWTSTE